MSDKSPEVNIRAELGRRFKRKLNRLSIKGFFIFFIIVFVVGFSTAVINYQRIESLTGKLLSKRTEPTVDELVNQRVEQAVNKLVSQRTEQLSQPRPEILLVTQPMMPQVSQMPMPQMAPQPYTQDKGQTLYLNRAPLYYPPTTYYGLPFVWGRGRPSLRYWNGLWPRSMPAPTPQNAPSKPGPSANPSYDPNGYLNPY